MGEYEDFLRQKSQSDVFSGFDPIFMPDFLFDFQRTLVEWSVRKGKSAMFADCGLGKGPMSLVWAENVVRHENKPVLITTPLAVSYQLLREGEKFGIECNRVIDGKVPAGARIIVTNYERLHLFDSSQFAGMVCDESSCLKNFNGVRKSLITEFMRMMPYRLLCTATAAPNDYIELGTSSEALGDLGYTDMLNRFFKNDQHTIKPMRYTGFGAPRGGPPGGEHTDKWRFKRHAEQVFWRWVCSWARAVRRPSDLGFDDAQFVLPPLEEVEHIVEATTQREGFLPGVDLPAVGLQEEREERRRTIKERCEKVANLVYHKEQALVWCHLNPEGDLLEKIIPGAVQVAGSDSDDEKEERLMAFADGQARVLVTKCKIGAWGLNLQGCHHVTFFPSHSFEQYYQGVRRCWRFGQKQRVRVDTVATPGERRVVSNLQRKATAADHMFSQLVAHMNNAEHMKRTNEYTIKPEVPAWLTPTPKV